MLDPVVEELINTLRGLQSDDPEDNTEANLNYVLARLLDRIYTSNHTEINNAMGMLFTTAFEYYRRVVAPFEDQKRFEEGEVFNASTVDDFVGQYIRNHADD